MGRFSEDTFDKLNHFVGVRLQMGVPLVDADWNEMEDIRKHELQSFLKWFVGSGVPINNDGFVIKPPEGGETDDFLIGGGDGTAEGAGRCLVDGWEVINESDLLYTSQSLYNNQTLADDWGVDPLAPLSPPGTGERIDTVYLDTWERELTPAEYNSSLYTQIGQDTCIRLKREWVVRAAEGGGYPPSHPQEGHVYYTLAQITRQAGKNAIESADIIDQRRTGLTISPEIPSFDIPDSGVDTVHIKDNAVTGQKLAAEVTNSLNQVSQNLTDIASLQTEVNSIKDLLERLRAQVEEPPPIPVLSSTNVKVDGFTLSWLAVAGATYYSLDVAADANFTTFIGDLNGKKITETTYAITGLQENIPYYSRIRSVNSLATSENSAVLTVTPHWPLITPKEFIVVPPFTGGRPLEYLSQYEKVVGDTGGGRQVEIYDLNTSTQQILVDYVSTGVGCTDTIIADGEIIIATEYEGIYFFDENTLEFKRKFSLDVTVPAVQVHQGALYYCLSDPDASLFRLEDYKNQPVTNAVKVEGIGKTNFHRIHDNTLYRRFFYGNHKLEISPLADISNVQTYDIEQTTGFEVYDHFIVTAYNGNISIWDKTMTTLISRYENTATNDEDDWGLKYTRKAGYLADEHQLWSYSGNRLLKFDLS